MSKWVIEAKSACSVYHFELPTAHTTVFTSHWHRVSKRCRRRGVGGRERRSAVAAAGCRSAPAAAVTKEEGEKTQTASIDGTKRLATDDLVPLHLDRSHRGWSRTTHHAAEQRAVMSRD